jgi:hypothetical protein
MWRVVVNILNKLLPKGDRVLVFHFEMCETLSGKGKGKFHPVRGN